ncbi:hypothetical protein P153DRAFT_395100 [Dothidotthia symphoricarpi CBS 119687]|uniref:Uncharacterized protein n=1 Tax=Dothidotthia symphoricarpi CBS 119687 TaxID=1392245 RepID=A0A6A6ALI4_9PLEO|nr:uncharacterized protein P153DRAFT_395100 [Dothidotthia symphoricarpi CBS 119687]KAF2131794.1 hypothetical protein P153DRAFT_395100 [Dothidotthia symphoricarpi CBS 119687]
MYTTILILPLALAVGTVFSAAIPQAAVPPVCGTIKVSGFAPGDDIQHAGCIFFGEPCRRSVSSGVDEIPREVGTTVQHALKLYGGSVCYDIPGNTQSYNLTDSSCNCEFFRFENCNGRILDLSEVHGIASPVPLEGAKSYLCQKS